MSHTPCSRSTALGLCQSRIDFLKRKLIVDQQITLTGAKKDGSKGTRPTLASPKTKASIREVPMPQFVIDALAAHIKDHKDKIMADERGLLFLTAKGGGLPEDESGP